MSRQITGLVALLIGIVALIGAVRGTWKRAWEALVQPDKVR